MTVVVVSDPAEVTVETVVDVVAVPSPSTLGTPIARTNAAGTRRITASTANLTALELALKDANVPSRDL